MSTYMDLMQKWKGKWQKTATRDDGGAGSGNWGHEGRPGKRGGSAGGGGVHNRLNAEGGGFTSFSKEKKKFATPHKASFKELDTCPEGTKLITDSGVWTKNTVSQIGDEDYSIFVNDETGEIGYVANLFVENVDKDVKLALPDSANKNYKKVKDGGDDRFSEERRRNAFSASDPKDADNLFRENTGKVWRELDDESKEALYEYTGSRYRKINGSLRNGTANDPDVDTADEINRMTDAISKVKLERDTWLYRGIDTYAAEKLFGCESGFLDQDWETGEYKNDVSALVGRSGKELGFMSCGTAKGKGFDGKDVLLSVYCPSGTEAIYAEPFSKLGSGDKIHWDNARNDGRSSQSYFSGEFETIVNRGAEIKVIGAERVGNQVRLEVQVVSQDHPKIEKLHDENV